MFEMDVDGLRFAKDRTPTDCPNRRNILIVGDVGVGKSSLINLIAGKDLANTSSGAKTCTLQSHKHIVSLDDVEFTLHDTVGLHDPKDNMKKAECLDSVYQAYSLISRLERSGGISLLVFCMKGGRISITSHQTYSLFAEVFCSRQVPVVIAVTHLEMYDPMEGWWEENEKDIKEYGFRPLAHVCITTTRGFRNAFGEQYEESRQIIRNLLLEYSGRIAWKEEKTWFKWAELHMRASLSPSHARRLDRSDLKKKLMKRCGFTREDAEFITQKMEQVQSTGDASEEDRSWFDEEFASNRSSVWMVAKAQGGEDRKRNAEKDDDLPNPHGDIGAGPFIDETRRMDKNEAGKKNAAKSILPIDEIVGSRSRNGADGDQSRHAVIPPKADIIRRAVGSSVYSGPMHSASTQRRELNHDTASKIAEKSDTETKDGHQDTKAEARKSKGGSSALRADGKDENKVKKKIPHLYL